jgi:tRNA A37 threonylcarbamoyladenosine biosynthesis protein TsaE
LDELGLDGDLAGRGVVAVEWPERLARNIPGAIYVRIDDKGDTIREITTRREEQ